MLMDPKRSREDHIIDLESGTNSIIDQQDVSGDIGSRVGQAKKLFNRVFISTDGLIKGEEPRNCGNHFTAVEDQAPNRADKVFEGEEVCPLEKKVGVKKPKKKGIKKPPKPPRPPKSPSLDAADLKLIHEISESALLKRARIERMKALKKTKNAKATSSSSNLGALIITVIFCIVMIWQGVLSGAGSSATFRGSPESSVELGSGGLISVQLYKNVSVEGHYLG